jgi:hypothetical protein
MSEVDIFGEQVIPEYGKIHALGHPALKHLLDGPVYVQEKVDGSQFSFGVLNGILRTRSSGREIFMDAPDAMFREGVEYVKSIQDRLVPGWIYRSEYLRVPEHTSLCYSRIPRNHIALFDIMTGHQEFIAPSNLSSCAEVIEVEAVPLYDVGELNLELFQSYLSRESFLGGQRVEGVVIKNYDRYSDQTGKVLMGKYVSEQFKETHKKKWGISNPGAKDIVQSIISTYKTDARWEKAVFRLRDRGLLEGSPRDIGNIIKEVWPDIVAECEDEIKETLWKHFSKEISRAVTKGVPEWYKQRLLHQQFEEAHD